jgi:two-component system chemotaxis sensor kinase CheA
MSGLDHFKATFMQECSELLGKLEHSLSSLSGDETDAKHLNEAFRAIHSIKGGAGMFGLQRLVAFAHSLEGILDQMRSGNVRIGPLAVSKALSAVDVLADLVSVAETGEAVSEHYQAEALEQLMTVLGITSEMLECRGAAEVSAARTDGGSPPGASAQTYRIGFTPGPDFFRRAIDPLSMIRALKQLGNLQTFADCSKLPAWDAFDPGHCHLSWKLELESSARIEDVREVFAFADGSCQLDIEVLTGPEAAPDATREVRDRAPAGLPDRATPANGKVEAGASEAAQLKALRDRRVTSIRVDLERVDKLVNLVGEIVISQSMVLQQIDKSLIDSNSHLYRNLSQLLQHTRSLQDSVMAIRAQPVRTIFSRLPRAVRDLNQLTGKNAVLETIGEETEIDKTIIEELSDPLIHLIRNSIGHGIEPEKERLAAGKPARGTIRVEAAQRGSRIVIQVSDDGRGIDRARVRERAIEMGLISADLHLSEDEIDNLIFLPGFSTAEAVSSISGRGVGMDVVLSNIQKIGGRVILRSEPGRGTATMLTLPLTLAVMEGMVVRAAGSTYLVPLNAIIECLITPRTSLNVIPGFGEVVNVRGRQVRIVDLATAFGHQRRTDTAQVQIVLVELENGSAVGFIVDEIIGQQQVVVKSVRDNFGEVRGIAGATILGDGGVALILDVSAISELPGARISGCAGSALQSSQAGVKAA